MHARIRAVTAAGEALAAASREGDAHMDLLVTAVALLVVGAIVIALSRRTRAS
jgi:hypothetical protein